MKIFPFRYRKRCFGPAEYIGGNEHVYLISFKALFFKPSLLILTDDKIMFLVIG